MNNDNKKHHINRKKVLIITVASVLAAFFLIVMPILTVIVYNENFGERFETAGWMAYSVGDFEGLECSERTFPSSDGHLLAGYCYSRDDIDKKGVVVIAHGFGGGGQNTYMDVADYFAANGYFVFAYDATGNDNSQGDSVEGLPQGVIDLDYALRFVKQEEEYSGLPIVLFGHSWGGYSVGAVLNCQPDVKAAVLVAGFDSSLSLFEQQGESMIGAGIKLFMPYVSLYERLKFGDYAAYTAVNGFANTDAEIMIMQSKDDTMVLPENGYEKFYRAYGDDPRFHFIEFENKGHNYVYYSEAAKEYKDQLNKDYSAYVAASGGEDNAEKKAEFMENNLDKSKCYEFDLNVMKQILDSYDRCCI